METISTGRISDTDTILFAADQILLDRSEEDLE
jgi:HD superfamily phosphohydrolase YqeK